MDNDTDNSPFLGQTTQFVEEQKDALVCPDCASVQTIQDETRGELICAQCGLVLTSNLIDLGPEWRAFTKEQQNTRRRVGSPINYARSDKGLSTTLGRGFRDAGGRPIRAHRRAAIQRMRKWQRRSHHHSSVERNLAIAMAELERLISQMRLPHTVRDSAAILYRRILAHNLTRGRTIDGIISGVLYVICRKFRIPITLKEISQNSRIDAKTLGRHYRFIMKKFDIEIPVHSSKDFVPRFAEELDLPICVEQHAIHILDAAQKKLIVSGKSPSGLAAASLYIASILEGRRKTQREISEVAKVTEVTIRNRYKELVKQLNLQMIA
ncbi:MAG: transcription initiation factor IIB family protein [Candidatus Hodarchaeota archaeon]